MHSPQQNKKAVLTTAVYFKVSTPLRSQGQFFRFKTEKVNTTIEFCITELV